LQTFFVLLLQATIRFIAEYKTYITGFPAIPLTALKMRIAGSRAVINPNEELPVFLPADLIRDYINDSQTRVHKCAWRGIFPTVIVFLFPHPSHGYCR
jgi:hypothetical protein